MPKFSVVIPLYDKETTIERAVRSVLSQTYDDLELIVVDDGSRDAGAQRVGAIRDPRLRLISQENKGVSAARNAGIDASAAGFVCFLDADDAWRPFFLRRINNLVEEFPNAAMFCMRYDIVAGNEASLGVLALPNDFVGIIENFYRVYRRSRSLVNSSSVCVRKSVLREIGGFPVGQPVGEDVYMWLRIAEKYDVAYDATIAATIYHDAPNRTHERVPMQVPYHVKYYLQETERNLTNRDLQRFLVSHCRIYAAAALQTGDRRVGLELSRLLWRHSKFASAQCLALAVAPRALAGLLRTLRKRYRFVDSRSVQQS